MEKDKKLNIAMMGHKVVPSRSGGIEVVVDELSKRLVEKHQSVTIFNRRRKDGSSLIKDYYGINIEDVFTVEKKKLDAIIYSYFATKKIVKRANKGEFDIVHMHAEGPCAFINKFPKKEKRNYKVVVTIHGLDWQRGKWKGFGSRFLQKCEAKIAKYADEIIVLSKANVEYFKEKYNRDAIYIPNGIEMPNLLTANIIKKEYGLDKDDYILFLARLVPEKGLDYLIPAWKEVVKKTGTKKKLIISGAINPNDDYCQHICDIVKGDESIIMTDYVSGDKLKELLSNAFLYVQPSDIEGMSISLLEAVSYGNVCLVSDIKENTEVEGENIFSFRKSDTLDLEQKIISLLEKNIPTHTKTVQPYKWEDTVEKTLEVYRK